MTRSPLALVVAATTLLAAGGAARADAAPPQVLGQTALDETFGSCGHCTLVQFGSGPLSFPYVVPSSGVLTKVRVFAGEDVDVSDWVQARTFRTSGPPDARVISEGDRHRLVDTGAGVRTFYDRVPATAGDVLGGRFHVLSRPEATPVEFPTASTADVAGISFSPPDDPVVGEAFAVESPAASQYRVNMQAVLESDVDGDGHGDTSQDLCPADGAVAVTACSGTLFGSRLQGPHTTGGGVCGYACLRVQKIVAGVSTAAPADGVVVRWRVLGAPAGSYRVRVVAPAGGASYVVLRSSAVEAVTADPSPLLESISTFATRLPIPAGGYVGLVPPPFAPRFVAAVAGSTYGQLNDAGDGMATSEGAPLAGELFYDADIEPDADHDGYGDVTQDGCPSDAGTQAACPPPVPATPTPTPVPPGGATSRPPAVALAKSAYRVKRGKQLKLGVTASGAGSYRLDLLRKGRRLKRWTGELPAGRSTVAVRVRREPGRYGLALTLTVAGQRATDRARLRVTR